MVANFPIIFTQESFSKLKIPFWNPYNFSGNVHLANSQTAVFYPLNFIYFIFKPIDAWTILVILGVFLSLVFTYLFSYAILKNKMSAVFTSLIFSFSGPMVVRIEDGIVIIHSFLWLPLVLYGIEKFLETKKKKFLFLSFLSLVSSVLAGWFQFSFYVIILSFLYFIFRAFNLRKAKPSSSFIKTILMIIIFFVLTLGTVAFHFLPAAEALKYSPRGKTIPKEFVDKFLLTKSQIVTFLEPDIFGNPGVYNFFGKGFYKETVLFIVSTALPFAIFASFFLRKKPVVFFFTLITTFCFLFGFRNKFSLTLINSNIPIISSFLPSRIFIVSAFSLSILSGFGFKRWLENYKTKKEGLLFFLGANLFLFACYLSILAWELNQAFGLFGFMSQFCLTKRLNHAEATIALRNFVLPFFCFFTTFLLGILGYFLKKEKRKKLAFIIIIVTLFYQFYFCNKYLYFSERENVFPSHPVLTFLKKKSLDYYRFWSFGKGYIVSNFSTFYKLFSPEGVDAMYPIWYARLFEGCGIKGEYPRDVSRIEAKICYAEESNWSWDDFYQKRLLNLLSVKYLVGLREDVNKTKMIIEKKIGPLVWKNDQWEIFENSNVLPRAFLAFNYLQPENDQQFLKMVYSSDIDLKKKVIIEKKIGGIDKKNREIQRAVIVKYSGNEVVIQAESEDNAILVLTDTYYPGWRAFIDGQETDIIRANYAFRAVKFPKGRHTVVFKYFPRSFQVGMGLSIISGVFLFLFLKKL